MFDALKTFTNSCDGDCRQALSLLAAFLTPLFILLGFVLVGRQVAATRRQAEAMAASFAAGQRETTLAQEWKRADFAARELRAFTESAATKRVFALLDASLRTLDTEVQPGILRPVTFAQEQGYLAETVDPDRHVVLTAALQPHEKKPTFTRLESAVRDDINVFLAGLERVERYIRSGLVGWPDVEPYLRYWIDLLNGGKGHVSRPFLETLRQYAAYYQFNDALALLMRGVPQTAAAEAKH